MAVVPPASVLLITGPPGAGKSTVSGLVADRGEMSARLECDWFWTTIVRGHIAPWLPEADAQNRSCCGRALPPPARWRAAATRW